jgi:peptide-methionine (S)-S-oxide reductase
LEKKRSESIALEGNKMKNLIYLLLWFVLVGHPGTLFGETRGKSSKFNSRKLQKATFAGGCFWCMEPPFDKLEGVLSTTVGYIGGHKKNPTYEEVCSGTTGHAEAVELLYDPTRVTYQQLMAVFWRNIDPTTPDRQFVDVGSQYRTAVFYHNHRQRKVAEASKETLDASGRFEGKIVTGIVSNTVFYEAETYHQDYYKRRPVQYYFYRVGSGRDEYFEKVWANR